MPSIHPLVHSHTHAHAHALHTRHTREIWTMLSLHLWRIQHPSSMSMSIHAHPHHLTDTLRVQLPRLRYDARHMPKLQLPGRRGLVQSPNLCGLLGTFFVRVRVLLEASDTILNFGAAETAEESAGLDAGNVHDG